MNMETENSRNILYHLRTPGTGAEGVHTRGMVNAFRNCGHRVDFIWPLGGEDPTRRAGSNPYDTKARKSILEHLVKLVPGIVFTLMEFCYNFWAIVKINSAVRHAKYRFIYERHFFFSFASGMVAGRQNIPLVLEVNELAGFERVRKNHLSWLARRCERYIFQRADIISVVSKFLKKAITEQYPAVEAEKIHVIPNGVEESFLSREFSGGKIREEYGLEGKKVFGFVGFLVPVSSWHALDWFLPLFIRSVEQYPDVFMMFVGGGPGRSRLEEIAEDMNFGQRIIFAGHVPNRDIGHYIRAMDIGVIPHTNEYRSPIKMFEYMSQAKPVLAPSQEPVQSVLGDIQNDYLFQAKSEESLEKTISLVLRDHQNWEDKGNRLREIILQRYTYERHGRTILDIMGKC